MMFFELKALPNGWLFTIYVCSSVVIVIENRIQNTSTIPVVNIIGHI